MCALTCLSVRETHSNISSRDRPQAIKKAAAIAVAITVVQCSCCALVIQIQIVGMLNLARYYRVLTAQKQPLCRLLMSRQDRGDSSGKRSIHKTDQSQNMHANTHTHTHKTDQSRNMHRHTQKKFFCHLEQLCVYGEGGGGGRGGSFGLATHAHIGFILRNK